MNLVFHYGKHSGALV